MRDAFGAHGQERNDHLVVALQDVADPDAGECVADRQDERDALGDRYLFARRLHEDAARAPPP